MAISENVYLAAQEESAWDAMYERVLESYKSSGHFAEDIARERDEAVEEAMREFFE